MQSLLFCRKSYIAPVYYNPTNTVQKSYVYTIHGPFIFGTFIRKILLHNLSDNKTTVYKLLMEPGSESAYKRQLMQ